MINHALSKIRNFRAAQRGLEIEAVIEETTEGWDLQAVCATAAQGVARADRDAIREMIRTEGLSISPEEAERALLGWCRTRVRDLIEEAETPTRLDDVVGTYLSALGEEDRARGETYEETAARLDDDIVRVAAARWHELGAAR